MTEQIDVTKIETLQELEALAYKLYRQAQPLQNQLAQIQEGLRIIETEIEKREAKDGAQKTEGS